MIVSNATPLIYLSKIKKLELLKKIFDEVAISQEVKKEIVDEGKKLNEDDVFLVEKAIESGWIKVKKVTSYLALPEIEKGEKSVISFAKEITFDNFLECLEKLAKEGFRLHEEIYIKAIEEAKKYSKDKN